MKPGGFDVSLINFRKRETVKLGVNVFSNILQRYYLEKTLICTLLKLNNVYFIFCFN